MKTSLPIAASILGARALGGCSNGALFNRPGERVYHPGAVNQALTDNDVVYRDRQGRYYCRRENGTTGTLVGAGVGALLGNIIAPGDSRTVGTLLGAGGGAVAGRAIDRAELGCR